MTLQDIEAQLKEPFAPEDVDLLPKGITQDKTKCMALPYADPRVYQDRLNKLAYGEWSTPAPVVIAAGNKLICYVTVILFGVAHTDVGEATNNEENTGTEAWAQAFKRACSHFGLGRYLYELEKEWVAYNAQRRQIELDAAGRRALVLKMYRKAGILTDSKPVASQPRQNTAPAPDEPVIENMDKLIANCRNRAFKAGVKTLKDYEALCMEFIGKPAPETLVDIGKWSGCMDARERQAARKAS